MRWNEIEARATEQNRADIEAVEKRESAQVAEDQAKREKEIQIDKIDREQVRAILDRFHVREALESVKDEVWHEGKIVPEIDGYGAKDNKGLLLVSNPFPELTLQLNKGKLSATVERDALRSQLIVEVSPIRESGEQDTRLLWVGNSVVFDIKRARRFSLENDVRIYGLKGLAEYARFSKWGSRRSRFQECSDISQPDAQGRFSQILVREKEFRQVHQTFPSDLRAWIEEIISKLPEASESGVINSDDLYEWRNKIALKGWESFFDRLSGYRLHRNF